MFQPYDVRLLTDTDADHRARKPPSLGGDDFAYGLGSPIISPGPGVVDLVDRDPGGSGGRMVGVRHTGGVRSEQLHASTIGVDVGQVVAQGAILGRSGGSAYGLDHGVGYHIHGHFTVNGVRRGWINYLASVGATTAGSDPRPDVNEQEEDEMRYTRIQHEERGIALVAPGYYKHLMNDEEVIESGPFVREHLHSGNARRFDVWVAIALNGSGAASSVDYDIQARIEKFAAAATISPEVAAAVKADGVRIES
jgi:hypothetical protein